MRNDSMAALRRKLMLQHLAERWLWLQETKRKLASYEYELARFIRESNDETQELPALPDPRADTTKINKKL